MAIPFIDLAAQQERIKDTLFARIEAVIKSGNYIMGPEVAELENKLSAFCGAKHTISCGNGTDALMIAMMALGVKRGDAVFCPSFTFAATAEMVPFVDGATPFFVDVHDDTYNMDVESLKRSIVYAKSLGLRPTGVIAVDLFGLPADYDAIEAVAEVNGMWLMGDSAQGFGGVYKGRTTGSIGKIATTSFFPAKPLGCYGDGGAIFTSDDKLAHLMQSYRFHGKGAHKYDNERLGQNSRLDSLQAAILLEKFAVYPDEIEKRQAVADRYTNGLSNHIQTPHVPEGLKSIWAQYTLQAASEAQRTKVMDALKEGGIPSVVYYPLPLHKQAAYRDFPCDPAGMTVSERLATRLFSLPMHPYLPADDQDRIINIIQKALT